MHDVLADASPHFDGSEDAGFPAIRETITVDSSRFEVRVELKNVLGLWLIVEFKL